MAKLRHCPKKPCFHEELCPSPRAPHKPIPAADTGTVRRAARSGALPSFQRSHHGTAICRPREQRRSTPQPRLAGGHENVNFDDPTTGRFHIEATRPTGAKQGTISQPSIRLSP